MTTSPASISGLPMMPVPETPTSDQRQTGQGGLTFTPGHHFALDDQADPRVVGEAAAVPLSVILQVTKRCDFNCGFCSETLQMADPTLSQLETIRGNLAGVQRVFLSGGEPLLRRDLPKSLTCIRRSSSVCRPTRPAA